MDDEAPEHPPLPPSHGAAPQRDRTSELSQSLCPLIQSVAAQNELPVEFFARLIWQESRLRPDAVGPVTRSGKRAQGIAQFMPATAAERFLLDAFDPAQALPKSADFLRELRAKFGNLGLAAAAYNAGPQRVQDWLSGKRTLPIGDARLRSQRDRSLCRGVEAAGRANLAGQHCQRHAMRRDDEGRG
jgi:soluble lytic murein transglycosylase-like protein